MKKIAMHACECMFSNLLYFSSNIFVFHTIFETDRVILPCGFLFHSNLDKKKTSYAYCPSVFSLKCREYVSYSVKVQMAK